MNRGAITSAKRVVIKIGSSSLTGSAGSELDPHAVQKVVDLAYSLKERGAEVVVARRKVVQPPRVLGFCARADGCGLEAFRGLHRTFEASDVVLRVKIPFSNAIPREDLVRGW